MPSSEMIRKHVEQACRQALEAHEDSPFVDFHDALHAAERMYSSNWKMYREDRGLWSVADEQRAARYAVPSVQVRSVFDSDVAIQRMLVARDERVSTYRHLLEEVCARHNVATCSVLDILKEFFAFASSTHPRPWDAVVDGHPTAFPGRDVWALWLTFMPLWKPYEK